MTEKELKKLSRAELLELLLMQTRESELLQMKLEASHQELDNRELKIRKAGTLADASIALNGVLESAQNAAQQYLDNIALMEQENRERCIRMLDEVEQVLMEAEQILAEARRDPVPIPPIIMQALNPPREIEPVPVQEPENLRQETTAPAREEETTLKKFWRTASHKALELVQRYGLFTVSGSDG